MPIRKCACCGFSIRRNIRSLLPQSSVYTDFTVVYPSPCTDMRRLHFLSSLGSPSGLIPLLLCQPTAEETDSAVSCKDLQVFAPVLLSPSKSTRPHLCAMKCFLCCKAAFYAYQARDLRELLSPTSLALVAWIATRSHRHWAAWGARLSTAKVHHAMSSSSMSYRAQRLPSTLIWKEKAPHDIASQYAGRPILFDQVILALCPCITT